MLLPFKEPTVIRKPLPPRGIRNTANNVIVLHYTNSENFASTYRYLRRTRKSYHYYISTSGTIYKFIDPKYKANHAGRSFWGGLKGLNAYSIGIALENKPPKDYTDAQYISLNWLLRQLQKRYPDISKDKLVGHSDVAIPRGRKIDPGIKFSWYRLVLFNNKTIAMEQS